MLLEEIKVEMKELQSHSEKFESYSLEELSKDCESLYAGFNELQMDVTRLNVRDKKKMKLDCYEMVYEFLCFVENDWEPDHLILGLNHSKAFSKLFEHFSNFCSTVENEFDIELESEKLINEDKKFVKKLKKQLGK